MNVLKYEAFVREHNFSFWHFFTDPWIYLKNFKFFYNDIGNVLDKGHGVIVQLMIWKLTQMLLTHSLTFSVITVDACFLKIQNQRQKMQYLQYKLLYLIKVKSLEDCKNLILLTSSQIRVKEHISGIKTNSDIPIPS